MSVNAKACLSPEPGMELGIHEFYYRWSLCGVQWLLIPCAFSIFL